MEEYTDDLHKRFKDLIINKDIEAIEVYEKMLKLLDKRRDEELSIPHSMAPEVSPADYAKMHEEAR